MPDTWKTYPNAPEAGRVICAASQVPEGATTSVDLDGFPILLVRMADRVLAYVNACPHQFLPLDYRSGSVLSSDGASLMCSNHHASFDVETGQGHEGLGVGCALMPIPVTTRTDGAVVVA